MSRGRLAAVLLFATAMGFLEAAVVVYLRLLYYPDGFQFPLVLLPVRTTLVELAREAATLVMLGAAAHLAGRSGWERYAWFSILFGAWDVVYYLGLWIVLGWPASVMTWDILFLIPLIWSGPVLAPLIVSAGLIGSGFLILRLEARGHAPRPGAIEWGALALSLALLLCAFMANHTRVVAGAVPERFPWAVFGAGVGLAALAGARLWWRRPRSGSPG